MFLHARPALLLSLLMLGTSVSRGATPGEPPPASLPGFDAELRALAAKLRDLARTDPARAFATYGPEFWRSEREHAFHIASDSLEAWAERDPVAPLLWLADQPRGLDDDPSSWVMKLVPNDADHRALADALLHAPGPVNRETLAALCRPWAEFHPAEALAWINALSDPALRADCLEKANSRNNLERPLPFPEQTLRLVLALPAGEHRDRQLADVLAAWLLRSPAAAESWAARRPETEVATALARAQESLAWKIERAYPGEKLGILAYRDPAAAIAEWERENDERIKADALGPIIKAWGQQDPAASLRWGVPRENDFAARSVYPKSRGRPMGPSRQSEYDGYHLHFDLVQAWAETRPLEALRWAEDLPYSHSRSDLNDYVWAIGAIRTLDCRPNRAKVAELYTQIRDPERRLKTLRGHVASWAKTNPAAALAWVKASPSLSAEQRTALLALAN